MLYSPVKQGGTMDTAIQTELKNEIKRFKLHQFGLNPKDWAIKPTKNNSYLIINQKDKDFKFTGRFEVKTNTWSQLELYSI